MPVNLRSKRVNGNLTIIERDSLASHALTDKSRLIRVTIFNLISGAVHGKI
jgi:hypothetical protein